jgi:hypothetical protein
MNTSDDDERCLRSGETRVAFEEEVEGKTHFADVDESAHQILVAERIHRVLSLFPRLVFHNSRQQSVLVLMAQKLPGHLPAALYSQRNQSYPSTTVLQITREKPDNQPQISPPCSFHSEVIIRLRTGPRRLEGRVLARVKQQQEDINKAYPDA